jgi:acyl-coenzyme A synthetase/AMP-(fatty) acid ligase
VEAADVRAHLKRQVDPPAAVGDVVLVDHLPVTEQGKPDRSIIGELLQK